MVGGLRLSWRPRAMGEPVGKSDRRVQGLTAPPRWRRPPASAGMVSSLLLDFFCPVRWCSWSRVSCSWSRSCGFRGVPCLLVSRACASLGHLAVFRPFSLSPVLLAARRRRPRRALGEPRGSGPRQRPRRAPGGRGPRGGAPRTKEQPDSVSHEPSPRYRTYEEDRFTVVGFSVNRGRGFPRGCPTLG